MRFPHPLALLAGCVLLAAALTWVVPAGRYERRDDPGTGRTVAVAGTYHAAPATPVGPFQAVLAIPKGIADAVSVVALVLLVGGAFFVVDRTGALSVVTAALARSFAGRELLAIPVVCLGFAAGGALENMQEEIIPLVPVLLVLFSRLGLSPLVAVAASLGSAAVGAAFSPVNPFQVLIAQQLAELPPISGAAIRLAAMAVALVLWIGLLMRHASATRTGATGQAPAGSTMTERGLSGPRAILVLASVLAAFGAFIHGVLRLGWGFDELSAVFFLMGVVAGLAGGLRIGGTAAAFAEGFAAVAYAGVLIGFARAITVVLDQGGITDTLVHVMVRPLESLPPAAAALGMMVAHLGIHVPVPSVSGQAVLTMPVLVPVSDLLDVSRQATVMAFQYGAGLSDLVTPTNGAMMAILAAARVTYPEWLGYALPRMLSILAVGAAAILIAA